MKLVLASPIALAAGLPAPAQIGAASAAGVTADFPVLVGHAAIAVRNRAVAPSRRAQFSTATNPGPARMIAPMLSAADAGHYAASFALQDRGLWHAADVHLAEVRDRVLIGTVLAQRYLSPDYRTSFAEAKDWLLHYGDQPEAREIWSLARRRAPRRQSVPRPFATAASSAGGAWPATAIGGLGDSGRDAGALGLPAEPPERVLGPPAGFEAGIEAWRQRRFGDAGRHFEQVAEAPRTASWYVAAAGFWAARSHLVEHRPEQVDRWLELAAQQPRTFYGMLSRRLLGMASGVPVGAPRLNAAEVAQLSAEPGGRRALALVGLGETDRAEAELRQLSARSGKSLANAVVALADIANMPSLCLALSPEISDAGRRVDALYPMPHWQPRNGFSVDRALMFALMMQESAFRTRAENRSGASGLMQLMPSTARTVAARAGIPLHRISDLVDPELNLSVAQEYVKQLIRHDEIQGNLIYVLAAYKLGTGSLAKLQTRAHGQSDPLLFLETLPRNDTRLYVERVLTNMWIYRQRLGQSAPDLDALAQNEWPVYASMNKTAR